MKSLIIAIGLTMVLSQNVGAQELPERLENLQYKELLHYMDRASPASGTSARDMLDMMEKYCGTPRTVEFVKEIVTANAMFQSLLTHYLIDDAWLYSVYLQAAEKSVDCDNSIGWVNKARAYITDSSQVGDIAHKYAKVIEGYEANESTF